jgi:predicted dehydrogenase
MFIGALAGEYREAGELVAFCDPNPARMEVRNDEVEKKLGRRVAEYAPADFEKMLDREKVDRVIVTTKDSFHDEYIVRTVEAGRDVVTEKPMTTDETKCQRILDAVARTGRSLVVTFNYRYSPARAKVKELLLEGTIGRVLSVHFEWLLDTTHGADYFRRWHRERESSGTLLVHKATHHFDLVNWWLASRPQTVYARGSLSFYGPDNRVYPWRGERCRTCEHREEGGCRFALKVEPGSGLDRLYYQAERHDGYLRDRCVFGEGITIYDVMAGSVAYDSGAVMSYSLNAYMPKEGYYVAFNGEKGRIELDELERSYVSGHDGEMERATPRSGVRITVHPHFSKAYEVEPPKAVGGHGGGDVLLLSDVFKGPGEDPLGRAADHIDGAYSILTGVAARNSIETGRPVEIADLVRFP